MTPDLHPEFGYLCPSPRLHRDARVAVVSVLLGAIIGGIGVVALAPDRDGHSYFSLRAGTAGSGAETAPFATADSTPANTDVTQRDPGGRTISQGDNVASDATSRDAGDDAAKGDVTKDDATGTAARTACMADKWIYVDGRCLAPKPRRVRVREAPAGSALAGVPIGRSDDAPAPAAPAPAAPAPAAAASAAPAATAPERSRGAASTSEAAPDDAAAAAPQKPVAAPPVAAPRKPQKTARAQNQNRRRDDAADDHDARDERADFRDERADFRIGRRPADEDYSRRGPARGGASAPEGPPALSGLWSWSGSW
jgi:hypothetical protein